MKHSPVWNHQEALNSVREEFIVTLSKKQLYTESGNSKVSGAGIVVRTGRKWKAGEAVQQVEDCLQHKVFLGSVARGRAKLKSVSSTQ